MEAVYTLSGPIDAGTYTIVGDGEIVAGADVRYSVWWRKPSSAPDGGADLLIVSFEHAFAGLSGPGQYSNSSPRPAVPALPGDLLVLRIELATDSPAGAELIPFGEAPSSPSERWITLAVP